MTCAIACSPAAPRAVHPVLLYGSLADAAMVLRLRARERREVMTAEEKRKHDQREWRRELTEERLARRRAAA